MQRKRHIAEQHGEDAEIATVGATIIYRLTTEPECAMQREAGVYSGGELDVSSGFIHLSSAEQVAGTAAAYFAGVGDLCVLAFDCGLIAAAGLKVRWEDAAPGGEVDARDGDFPHVYGGPIPFSCATAQIGCVP
jgi:uncharacterized protein (DUF952 family)